MSEKAKVNFDRELTILQNVRHPNLVEFFGIVAEQNRVSFVMEFCRGGRRHSAARNEYDSVCHFVPRPRCCPGVRWMNHGRVSGSGWAMHLDGSLVPWHHASFLVARHMLACRTPCRGSRYW